MRGDYYGVALLPFGLDTPPQTGQAVFVVGFVKKETSEVNEEEVMERGEQLL